jgi:hypothetical protein
VKFLSEEKKRRREGEAEESEEKTEKEEALSIGRILGVIARRNPELYRAIVQLKEMEGRKLTDIVEEALEMYVEFKTSFAIMPRELFYALRIIDFVTSKTMENIAKAMQLIAGMASLMTGYGYSTATGEEEKKEEKRAGVSPELRSKLIEAMLPIMQSLINIIMQTVAKAFLPQQLQQQVATPPSVTLPTSKKIKIVSSASSSTQPNT